MSVLGDYAIVFSTILVLFLVLVFFKIFHKLWWLPSHIQKSMRSQGIKGPPYKFIHGNTKEIINMKKEAMATPMGLSHAIFPRVQPDIASWVKIYGKKYLQWHGAQAQLIVAEPELIKEIMNNKDRSFPKPESEGYLKKLLGDGLFSTEGEKWGKLRKLANYAFHGESLKNTIPAMISGVEIMLERWKAFEGKEVEVFEEFRWLTSEVISRAAFGSNYQKGKNIFEILMRLSMLMFKNMYKVRFPVARKFLKTGDEIEAKKLEEEIRNNIIEILKEREEMVMRGEKDSYGNDFLGLLLKAHHETNDSLKISVDDLVDECKTFYFAGQETTNTLLGWTVLLLATHTDWQEEVRKEVLSVFGHQNPNAEGIAKLKTMGMAFNETLRLYPPIVGTVRKVRREVRVGKLTLPADLVIFIQILAVHHDPQIWGQDADQFKPERFSEGVAEATKNNTAAAFYPFGIGPRNCVGNNFAITEAKVTLSMILQRYSFTLSPAYVHSPFQLLTLHPQHGIQVILHPL